MKNKKGVFIISLDFELMWGVRDKRTIQNYGNNILNVHEVIPRLLHLFNKYEVRVTLATVGFLFGNNKNEVLAFTPKALPTYQNSALNPYPDLMDISDANTKYYFAKPLIEVVKSDDRHEIATHTFSHFYCNEPGQTPDQFDEDLKSAVAIAKTNGISIRSIVFPRNQVQDEYLDMCLKNGIDVYRGNDDSGLFNTGSSKYRAKRNQILRFMDSYIPISGHNAYSIDMSKEISNVRASRFLRPYSNKFSFLERLKIKRITGSMTHAAKNGLAYHLWWHPHNFGSNTNENLRNLEEILTHYMKLQRDYGMESKTMGDFSKVKE